MRTQSTLHLTKDFLRVLPKILSKKPFDGTELGHVRWKVLMSRALTVCRESAGRSTCVLQPLRKTLITSQRIFLFLFSYGQLSLSQPQSCSFPLSNTQSGLSTSITACATPELLNWTLLISPPQTPARSTRCRLLFSDWLNILFGTPIICATNKFLIAQADVACRVGW